MIRSIQIVVALAAVLAVGACKSEPAQPSEGSVGKSELPPVKKDLPPVNKVGPAGTGNEAPLFQLAVAPPAAAKAGEPAVVSLAVTPAVGYVMNPAFPIELSLTPPAGVTAKRVKQTATEATKNDKKELAFDVELTAATAGTHRVTGELKFAVCTADESACLPQTKPVEVAVDVK